MRYITTKVRKYDRRRRIKFNIPVNIRNQKKKKRERPIKEDRDEFKKKNAV